MSAPKPSDAKPPAAAASAPATKEPAAAEDKPPPGATPAGRPVTDPEIKKEIEELLKSRLPPAKP